MKNPKRLAILGLISFSLFASLASSARADDDDWGRISLGLFLGAPVYRAPVYVAPPPPPPAVEYRYYSQPSPPVEYRYYDQTVRPWGYDDQRNHDWRGHDHWVRHHREENDDDD